MNEFSTIINECDENTMVLGDELCSGTEIGSAIGIFIAGLEHLHNERECSFVFATHLHSITNNEHIQNMERLKIQHMSVVYDIADDKLIYDRKLKDGPGTNSYGLEVCKSLGMNQKFLENAYRHRNMYQSEQSVEALENLSLMNSKKSKYNSEKHVIMCELCEKKQAVDTHHLIYQSDSNDENGYIGANHKNHKANLASVCKDCHDHIHKKEYA